MAVLNGFDSTPTDLIGPDARGWTLSGFYYPSAGIEYDAGFSDGISSFAAPTITVISPTPGVAPGQPGGFAASWATARVTPIVIEVDGASLALACVVARYPSDDGELERVVYRRGRLRPGFELGSAAQQVTATKLRLTILPDRGWPTFSAVAAIELDVDAIAGAALSLSSVAASS